MMFLYNQSQELRTASFALRRMEVPARIAPAHGGFADPCLTTWLRHRKRKSGPQDTWASGDRKGAGWAYCSVGAAASAAGWASVGGCMVAFSRMATMRSSAEASMETGVATVKVYPVFPFAMLSW